MKENKTAHVKNLVLIVMGIVVSIAGTIYIVKQYSKLLTEAFAQDDILQDDGCVRKVKRRFRQIPEDEVDLVSPEDEDDLVADIVE